MKKSPSKNNVYSKVVTSSSPKRKLQKEKKDSSNGDLDISDEYDGRTSKKLKLDNSNNVSTSTSASEEDKGTGKSLSRKKVEMDVFEERIEKKKQRAILYEKYLQRGGARNPGSKEIPTVRNFTYNNNIMDNSEQNRDCSSIRLGEIFN